MRTKPRTTDVYARLRELILSNHLRPGARLPDRDLAVELGVSRTPVREALGRLEQDGLVMSRAGGGYAVVDLDAKQIADLYDLREALEAHAIRLAAARGTPAALEALAEVLARLRAWRGVPERRADEIRVGLAVHEVIARATGNAFLHDTIVRLLDRMHTVIWIETLHEDAEAADATQREHEAFLMLIRAQRADEAEALMRAHIRSSKAHILRVVQAREAFYGSAGPGRQAGADSPTDGTA